MTSPTQNELDLVQDCNRYYDLSLRVMNEFEGPSIYFHVEAIKAQRAGFLSLRHIEMIYATLASWGMHRMGDPAYTKAKMVRFTEFLGSILEQKESLEAFLPKQLADLSAEEYRGALLALKPVFLGLRVSLSNATLVAHSKTLAHVLPDLIPPIDRMYTVRFFTLDRKDFFPPSGKDLLRDLPPGPERHFDIFVDHCCRIKWLFDQCEHDRF